MNRILNLVLLALLTFTTPAWTQTNQLVTVDPQSPPADILQQDELSLIQTLDNIWQMSFVGQVNPDEKTAFIRGNKTNSDESFYGFWHIDTGEIVSLEHSDIFITHSAWHQTNQVAIIFRKNGSQGYFLGYINTDTGRIWVEIDPLPINGNILSMSPDGTKLLSLEPVKDAAMNSLRKKTGLPTVKLPLDFMPAEKEGQFLEVTADEARLVLLNLETLKTEALMTVPPATIIPRSSFSPDAGRLALVLNFFEESPNSAVRQGHTIESLANYLVQDALGALAPEDNPFYANSQVMIFETKTSGAFLSNTLEAKNVPGEFPRFSYSATPSWNPAGNKLLVKTDIPAKLKGRTYSTYYKEEQANYLVLNPTLTVNAQIDQTPVSYPDASGKTDWFTDNEIFFVTNEGLDTAVYLYTVSNGSLKKITAGGSIHSLLALPDQRSVFTVRSQVDQAPELFSVNLDTKQAVQLTWLNTPATQTASVKKYKISVTLGSGDVRNGYWFAPKNMAWPPQNQPVVFWQAGGPGVKMIDQWSTNVEKPLTLMPSLGLSVLMMPLQQRPGWGVSMWNELADNENFGKVDIDELAEIAQQLVDRGWVSPDGLGISGCSYGGYMTAQSIVRYPDLWKAANPQCSLLDLITEFQTGYSAHIAYLTGGVPWKKWQHYLEASPGFFGSQVKAHTLIFHGAQDFLPLAVAENFFYDIYTAGTNVRMLRFLEEAHGLYQQTNRFYAVQEQIQWFRDHLK